MYGFYNKNRNKNKKVRITLEEDYKMKELVIKVDDFKFGIFDKVPVAEANQCILLYREGFGGTGAIVINNYTRPMISDIRHGKFNKIAYLSTSKKSADYSFRLAMKDYEFNFNIRISLGYSLQNAAKYYFENLDYKDKIRETINMILRSFNKKYKITEEANLQSDIQTELKIELNQYNVFYFHSITVLVEGDSDAQQILRSKRKKQVEIVTYGDQTEIKKSKLKQDEELKKDKISWIMELASEFGMLAPIIEAYSKGEISDEQLFEYIERNKVNELENLKSAMDSDLLSTEEIQRRTNQILNSSISMSTQTAQIEAKPAFDEKETEKYVVDYPLEDEDSI